MHARAALFVALLALGSWTTPSHAERVDRVLAVVGDRIVTVSDVEIEDALVGHLDCPEPALCNAAVSTLDRLIDIAIIRGLAGDAATYRPPPGDLDRRLITVRASWSDPEGYGRFLTRFGFGEDDFAGLVFSRMVVERYVQRNVVIAFEATGSTPNVQSSFDEWIGRRRAQVSIRRVAALEGG